MLTVRYADALILDLRANGGGSPETVSLLASYFFDAPQLPLFEIVDRSGKDRLYVTEKELLPERNESRPFYMLTSARTFSAGEGIAFVMRNASGPRSLVKRPQVPQIQGDHTPSILISK